MRPIAGLLYCCRHVGTAQETNAVSGNDKMQPPCATAAVSGADTRQEIAAVFLFCLICFFAEINPRLPPVKILTLELLLQNEGYNPMCTSE